MANLEFRHVSKVYPEGAQALKDLCLQVDDGEMMVLVGPSGCGKSTALRLLSGLEQVSDGELLIGGKRMNERSPQQRDIALVFQNYALYPHMTVYRNLEFPLRMMNLPKLERSRRVEETARLLDLMKLLERRPGQLSGGQRQRVAMGRAMVRHPQVFLMDEPLSNLDARLRIQIRAEISNLQRRLGVTTLYVTHDQVEAMTLGDRIAVLNAGRLQQLGRPQELYDRPANTFVAGFMGNPGMNILGAKLNHEASLLELAGGGWRIPLDPLLSRIPALSAYLERSVLAGMRPEAFSTEIDLSIDAVVETVESLGHERLVYFRPLVKSAAGQLTLVARLPGAQRESAGQTISLGLDPTHLYFFNMDGDVIA